MPEDSDLWSHKPWWCQPWSILLTGAGVVGASVALFHTWWLSLGLLVMVLGWWWIFLVQAPRSHREWALGHPAEEMLPTGAVEGREADGGG